MLQSESFIWTVHSELCFFLFLTGSIRPGSRVALDQWKSLCCLTSLTRFQKTTESTWRTRDTHWGTHLHLWPFRKVNNVTQLWGALELNKSYSIISHAWVSLVCLHLFQGTLHHRWQRHPEADHHERSSSGKICGWDSAACSGLPVHWQTRRRYDKLI